MDDELHLLLSRHECELIAAGNDSLGEAAEAYTEALAQRLAGDEDEARREALRGYAACSHADGLYALAKHVDRLLAADTRPPLHA